MSKKRAGRRNGTKSLVMWLKKERVWKLSLEFLWLDGKIFKKGVIGMYGIIYKVTNKLDGKNYIGQTRFSVKKRFKEHARADSLLGKAIRKDGIENFIAEVIEECETRRELDEREIYWIKQLGCLAPNGYNQHPGLIHWEVDFETQFVTFVRGLANGGA